MRKRKILRANGFADERESFEEIKIEQIKNKPLARSPTHELVPQFLLLNNSVLLPTGMTVLVPTLPLWQPLVYPLLPLGVHPFM